MSECSCHISPPCSWCVSLCPRCRKAKAEESTEGWDEPACAECREKVLAEIPVGFYCYERLGEDASITTGFKIRPCPFWSKREGKPEQQDGYCSLLGAGDWEQDGLSLLWDQVKECNENIGDLQDP